jgi:hypothetical protein
MHAFLTQKLLPLIAPQSLAIDRQTYGISHLRIVFVQPALI